MTSGNTQAITYIQTYLKESYNLLVGDLTAKRMILESRQQEHPEVMCTFTIRGRSLVSSYPMGIELTVQEIIDVLDKAGFDSTAIY